MPVTFLLLCGAVFSWSPFLAWKVGCPRARKWPRRRSKDATRAKLLIDSFFWLQVVRS